MNRPAGAHVVWLLLLACATSPRPVAALEGEAAVVFAAAEGVTTADTEIGEFDDAPQVLRKLLGGSNRLSLVLEEQEGEVRPLVLSMSQAVAATLLNNREAQAQEPRMDSARWDRIAAWAQLLPTATASAGGGQERSEPAAINDAFGKRVADSRHFRRDRALTVTQPVVDLTMIAGIRAAQRRESLTALQARDTKERLAYDTVSAYLDLLQARLTVELAERYISSLADLRARMQSRVDAGGATAADLDRIVARAGNADAARIEALGLYDASLAEFGRLTGVEPTDLVIPDVVVPEVPGSPEVALQKAIAGNPAYGAALQQVKLAEADRERALAGALPRLSLVYSDTWSYNAGGSALGNPVDGVYPTQRSRTAAVVVQWALGAGAVTGAMSAGAKAREQRLRAEDQKYRLEQALLTGYATVNAANKRYKVLREGIQSNDNVVRSFEEQFAEGSRSVFELLDAYEQLYSVRVNFIQVAFTEAKAGYQIHRQLGDVIPTLSGGE